MKKVIIMIVLSLLVLASCSPESNLRNMKNPASVSEYYDNLSRLYSFAIDQYNSGYEKLRKLKINCSSYDEFAKKSLDISASVNESLMVYYKALSGQLQYSIATGLDPFDRVLKSLDSEKTAADQAKEKYGWILSDKAHVGNEQSLRFAEAAFDLDQSAKEIMRLNTLIGK